MVRARRVAPGGYRVAIEPVTIDPAVSPAAGAAAAVGEFAARLEAWVRDDPADWERWSTFDPAADLLR
jgi:hypothetical protein